MRPDLPKRRMVVDHQIPWEIAQELRARGYRDAMALLEMDLHQEKDPKVIAALTDRGPPSVLVTFDNDLAYNHRDQLVRAGLPLAVVDSEVDWAPRTEDEYKRDVIHRWAHSIGTTAESGVAWWYSHSRPRSKEIAELPPARIKRRGRSVWGA